MRDVPSLGAYMGFLPLLINQLAVAPIHLRQRWTGMLPLSIRQEANGEKKEMATFFVEPSAKLCPLFFCSFISLNEDASGADRCSNLVKQ